MAPPDEHPLRYALANELHARPFPALEAPCHVVFMAFKEPVDAANRDRALDRDHLIELLDRNGAPYPPPESTHFSAPIGRADLRWESHTEFVTYTAFVPGLSSRPFDPVEAEIFPEDWLERTPGRRLVSVLLRIEELPEDETEVLERLEGWFVPESLVCSRIVDASAIVACDFRIDPAGHMRFAVFVKSGVGARRIGRMVTRLCEIETYRAMSMLGLMRARALNERLNAIDPNLSALVSGLDEIDQTPDETLHDLLKINAELESLAVQFTFRFGATGAYEAIVNDRIDALREERITGRQTFAEFMARRYDPAMRTVKSAEQRLRSMAERAQRAAELLRTRVDVERSAQNQKLLESMDRRADLQLRLQRTVEGLSVVAISYYAVSLLSYVVYPVTDVFGISKALSTAALTPLTVLMVWLSIRRIHRMMH